MSKPTSADNLTSEDARTILGLRLLIARAANRDSLAWWDDESLTPHAGFLLGRIFPMAPLWELIPIWRREPKKCLVAAGAGRLRLEPDRNALLARAGARAVQSERVLRHRPRA